MRGGEGMSKTDVKEILEKQLQLLSEQSNRCVQESELAALTSEMVRVAELLLSSS